MSPESEPVAKQLRDYWKDIVLQPVESESTNPCTVIAIVPTGMFVFFCISIFQKTLAIPNLKQSMRHLNETRLEAATELMKRLDYDKYGHCPDCTYTKLAAALRAMFMPDLVKYLNKRFVEPGVVVVEAYPRHQ
jgi:hypothetical protein